MEFPEGYAPSSKLRLVFAELQMVPVRNTVSFQNADDHFAQNGGLPHLERADAAAGALLGQLAWWARALRRAKAMEPLND